MSLTSEEYIVKIERYSGAVYCGFSSNTPCMLADEIRKVVEDFYKEDFV